MQYVWLRKELPWWKMAGLVELIPKLRNSLTIMVTMPFSLCKLAFKFCTKTIFIVIQTWVELVKAAVSFHVNMFWKAVIWMVALVSIPVRVLTALQRERLVSFDMVWLDILSAVDLTFLDGLNLFLLYVLLIEKKRQLWVSTNILLKLNWNFSTSGFPITFFFSLDGRYSLTLPWRKLYNSAGNQLGKERHAAS